MILSAMDYNLEQSWPILLGAMMISVAIIVGALIVRSGKS